MYVDSHALERFRIHHPEADFSTLLQAIRAGVEIESGTAMSLVGRARTTTDQYFLPPDRRGMFAVCQGVVVTYLRFQKAQRQFCLKHWPSSGYKTEKPVEIVPQRRDAPVFDIAAATANELQTAVEALHVELKALQESTRATRETVIATQNQEAWVAMKPLWSEAQNEIIALRRPLLQRISEIREEYKRNLPKITLGQHLIDATGSHTKAWNLLARAEKVKTHFDTNTWAETRTLRDHLTGLTVTLQIPHGVEKGFARIAA